MTDAETIKDMEACAKQSCSECSMYGNIEIEGYCDLELMKNALDLILRQQKQFQLIANFLKERKDEAKQKSIDTGDKYYRGYMRGVDFAEQLIKEKDEWKRE